MKKINDIKYQAQKILQTLTLDEKVGQMCLCGNVNDLVKMIEEDNLNVIFGGAFITGTTSPENIEKINRFYAANDKIPLIWMSEALHGVMNPKATIFPQSIAMASTFNEDLMEMVADEIGKEANSLGINVVFAPNVDISRDPRWGRVQENFGEDPYLTARMGVKYVEGVQKNNVAATVKHYLAHGVPEGGLNLAPVHMGEREMREIAVEPFEECIKAGAMSIMPAYSELDGEPLHSSVRLLRCLLRDELGFEGTVISDFAAIWMLNNFHQTAESSEEAGIQALLAGVDMEAPVPFGYGKNLINAIKSGKVNASLIDEAVLRILTQKLCLGLFEKSISKEKLHKKESIQLAKKAADESAVLLKNNGILPLKKNSRIALIGCHGDNVSAGDYSFYPLNENCITLKEALIEKLGNDRVLYSKGCNINSISKAQLKEAVDVAKQSDVVVMALGDNSNFFGGIGWGNKDGDKTVNCGEGFDVNDLDLPSAQRKLFEEIKATGKKIVLIIFAGRPYTVLQETEHADAFIWAWYLGEQGCISLADMLFGDVVPSGKLPISFPRTTGSIPCFYNHKPSARGFYKESGTLQCGGRDYVFDTPDALFPFGYGLSYTKFEYSNLKITGKKVTVDVENTGDYDAYESVLLYVCMKNRLISQPVKKLRNFKKVFLKKSESKRIEFLLCDQDFEFINVNMKKQLAIGTHLIEIGGLTAEIIILGENL